MRVIDANALKKSMKPHVDSMKIKPDMTWEDIWKEECNFIDDAPTLFSVIYGKWKRSKHYPHIIFCDDCGEPYEISNSMEHWNYCPNCGSKKMGVEDER